MAANTTLNIKVNPEIDVDELKKALKKLEGIEISPEINSDAIQSAYESAMDGYQKLEQAMSNAITLDVNSGDAEKVLDELYDAIHKVENQKIDLSTSELAAEFEKAQNELKQLADTQEKALKQMRLSGKQGSEAYKELEEQLKLTKEQLETMDGTAKKQGDSMLELMAKFEALSKLSEGLSSFVEKGTEVRDAMREVAAQTGSTAEEMQTLKASAEQAYKNGVGESVASAVKAMGTAKQMLGNTLDPNQLNDFVVSAQGIATVFDKDINEVIAGSRTFIGQFKLDGKEAGDLIAYAMQNAGSKADDVLDTLDEYSQLVKTAGYSAQEFTGIMSVGLKNNVRDTDKLADAIKETQIRLNAGDTEKALAEIKSPITATIQGIQQLASSGQISVKEMLQRSTAEIEKAFNNKQIGTALRDQFNTALSGTMAEDIGGANFDKIFSQAINVDEISKKAAAAGDAMKNAIGSVSMFDSIKKEFDVVVTQISGFASPIVGAVSGILTPISQIAPGIILMKDTFGGMSGKVLDVAKNIVNFLVPGLIAQTAAQEGASAAQTKFNLAALKNPYILAAAAIAGIVLSIKAISAALYESAQESLDNAKAQDEVLNKQIKLKQSQIDLVQSHQSLIDEFKNAGAAAMENKDLLLNLASAYPGVIDSNKSYEDNLRALEGQSTKTGAELTKLKGELGQLAQQKIDLQVKMSNIEINVEKQKIEDTLQDALGNFMNDAADWTFGTSTSRQAGEALIKPYTDALYNAKDDKQLQKAAMDFQMAVLNGAGGFGDLNDEEKAKIVGQIDAMAKAKSNALKVAQQDIEQNYQTMKDSGMSEQQILEFIAKKRGVSVEQVKELVNKQKESKAQADAQKTSVEGIAEAWNKAKSAVDSNIDTQRSLYSSATNELNLLKKKGIQTEEDKKRVKELAEQQKAALKQGKEGVAISKQNAKYAEQFDKSTGLKIEQGKSELELAQQEYKIKSDGLENDKELLIQAIKRNAIQERRKLTADEEKKIEQLNLDTIKEQKDAYIEAYKAKGLITGVDSEGKIEFTAKVKKKESKNQIQADLNKISEQQLSVETNVSAKIDTNQLNNELTEAQFNLNKKKLEIGIETGKITGIDEITETYKSQYEAIAKQRADLSNKLLSATDTEKIEIQKKLVDLEQKEIAINEDKKGMYKKYSDYKINQLSEAYDIESKLLEKQSKYQSEAFNRIYDAANEASGQAIEKSKSIALDGLDSKMNAELARIGDNEKAKAKITEKYEKLKADTEKEYANKSLVTQSQLAGAKSAFETAELVKTNAKKKELLDAQLAEAIKAGDKDKTKDLQKQLDEVNQIISENGDVLAKTTETLGIGLETAMTNAFSGNGEGAKKGMKASLAEIAGYLQELATAKVVEVVLKSDIITGLASLAGFAAPLVYAGAIALIRGAMNALISPIIQGMLSFPTGAGYINQPTLMLAGDGARLGGENREVLLRDDQFQATLENVLERQRAEMAQMVSAAILASSSERLVLEVGAESIYVILERYKQGLNTRTRTTK